MQEAISEFTRIRPTTTKDLPSLLREAIENPLAVQRELNNRSLYQFLQYFWEDVSQHTFQPNWHIEYLCKELGQVALQVGDKRPRDHDLIVNVSPGSSKTITCSIMFVAWCWTKWPWMRFITASYSGALSLESAEHCRDLIRSDRFQAMYPDIAIKEDKDTKSNYRIVKKEFGTFGTRTKEVAGGSRYSTSVGGTLTGFHGDIIIVDDPLNPSQAVSDVELANANNWMEQTLSTRKTQKAITPTILIMQRLAQNDPTGHMLEKQKENVKHICIPGEIRNFRMYASPPSILNYYKDDLMDPVRLPWSVLKDLEADLGQYGYAGQIGQNPTPPGGGMFKVDHMGFLDQEPVPNSILKTVRYWDKAGTEGAGDYTVGVRMSLLASGKWLIEDMKRGRWGSHEREAVIRATAEADGTRVQVWVEQEAGPIWEEELAQMADGTKKKLKDIVIGDSVINGEGKPTKVTNVFIQGEIDCLSIATDSGRIINAGREHPFLTPVGWVTAEKLNVEDVLALKTDIRTIENNSHSLEECRLAGYFIGDGCVTFTRGSKIGCNSSIVSSDPIEGLDIIHCGEKMGWKVLIGGSKGWTYQISGGVKDWLREYDLAGKNTFTKTIPDWVLKGDKERISNFLGAYFACDGSVTGKDKQHCDINYYSTNIELLKETQSLLLRFGIYTMLRRRVHQDKLSGDRHMMYFLVMRKRDGSMGRFASNIPVYGRKSDKLKDFKQISFLQTYFPDPIVSIDEAGKLPCRCLEVESGESFLVQDIVVHNSGGKESAEGTIRNLAGYVVRAERPTGDKIFRADPFSVQVNNGNVMLLKGSWNSDLITEFRYFPMGNHDDCVDASCGAWHHLIQKKVARRIT